MESAGLEHAAADPAVGLCSLCRHGRVQESAAGARFWRCLRAATDPGYRKYPPLPVRSCPGFQPTGHPAGWPQTRDGDHR